MVNDILDELRKAAASKWQGDPSAQRAGLFARAADEIELLREVVEQLLACHEEPECPAIAWAQDVLSGRHE